MKTLRIHITALTSSFRYPSFVVGVQPTLPVPPLSTIYGLISAAKGIRVTPNDVSVGYLFFNNGEGVDLETVYELESARKAKSNVVKREFLSDINLYLYIDDLNYKKYFKKPYYPLLLGKSDNLAKINNIKEVDLEKRKEVKLGKTILPFSIKGAHGTFYSLPTYFTDTIPREAKGVKPFILMDKFFNYMNECYFDPEMDWGVWMYNNESNIGKE